MPVNGRKCKRRRGPYSPYNCNNCNYNYNYNYNDNDNC
jgi:hypothetical protein